MSHLYQCVEDELQINRNSAEKNLWMKKYINIQTVFLRSGLCTPRLRQSKSWDAHQDAVAESAIAKQPQTERPGLLCRLLHRHPRHRHLLHHNVKLHQFPTSTLFQHQKLTLIQTLSWWIDAPQMLQDPYLDDLGRSPPRHLSVRWTLTNIVVRSLAVRESQTKIEASLIVE